MCEENHIPAGLCSVRWRAERRPSPCKTDIHLPILRLKVSDTQWHVNIKYEYGYMHVNTWWVLDSVFFKHNSTCAWYCWDVNLPWQTKHFSISGDLLWKGKNFTFLIMPLKLHSVHFAITLQVTLYIYIYLYMLKSNWHFYIFYITSRESW